MISHIDLEVKAIQDITKITSCDFLGLHFCCPDNLKDIDTLEFNKVDCNGKSGGWTFTGENMSTENFLNNDEQKN